MHDDDSDPERLLRGCGLALLIGIGLWIALFVFAYLVVRWLRP